MATKEENENFNAPALDWMKCNICLDRFTQPRVLPCLHTFCQTCLQRHTDFYCSGDRRVEELQERAERLRSMTYQGNLPYNEESFNALRERLASAASAMLPESMWRQIRETNKTFPCPTCREKIELPANGINGFRHDFRVSQLQEWLENLRERQQKLDQEQKRRTKLRKTSERRGVNGDEMSCECWFHPDEELKLACLDCSAAICKSCLEEKHTQHKTTDLHAGMKLFR